MNANKIMKFRLRESLMPVLVFFLIILTITIALIVTFELSSADTINVTLGGMESGIYIFLFIMGLSSFKDIFHMSLQNGVSRKTMFKGNVLSTLIIAGVLTILSQLLMLGGKIYSLNESNFSFNGYVELLYATRYLAKGGLSFNLFFESTIYIFCFSISALALGYLISNLYYRFSKKVRVVVSISVPVILFVIVPIWNFAVADGKIYTAIWKIISFVLGLTSGNPYYAIVTAIVGSGILLTLSWLLTRKTELKN